MSNLRSTMRHTRPYLLIFAVSLALVAMQALSHMLAESRTWRDLTGQTPFHSVTVDDVSLDDLALSVSGTMIKRRCDIVRLSAYVVRSSGVAVRVAIDTAPEDATRPQGNRPALPDAQYWGPWVLRPLDVDPPQAWSIYAHHNCPDETTESVNLFASGDWPEGGEE